MNTVIIITVIMHYKYTQYKYALCNVMFCNKEMNLLSLSRSAVIHTYNLHGVYLVATKPIYTTKRC